MPGQFTANTWGCYVMDVDAQTLAAYKWFEGDKNLRLVAARSFRNDRRLHDFNTDSPTPAEVAKLLELEDAGRRDNPQPAPPQTRRRPTGSREREASRVGRPRTRVEINFDPAGRCRI